MSEVVIGLIVVMVPLALILALVVMEVVFRRSEPGRLWRRIIDAEKEIEKALRRVDREVDGANRRMREAARTYEHGYVRRLLRRRPIRDLKPYLSVSMSWAALERAGIDDLNKFLSFQGNFRQLRGIGQQRASGLRQARQELVAELAESTLPMPTLRGPGSLEFEVITTALRSAQLHRQALPERRQLEEQLEQARTGRPGSMTVRWQHFFGDRQQLQQQLQQCADRMEPLARHQAPQLVELVHQAGSDGADYEQVGQDYQDDQETVKALLDRSTKRAVRGALRPVGVAAMRAAEGFDDEEDFCDRALEPLVAKLGYNHRREHTINRRIGSRDKTMYVDFFLLDDRNKPVAVLEAKRSIRTDNDLEGARQQGLSYALFEQLRPVMVAAPEGLWVYERHGQQLEFHDKFDIEQAFEQAGRLRELIDVIGARQQQRPAMPAGARP